MTFLLLILQSQKSVFSQCLAEKDDDPAEALTLATMAEEEADRLKQLVWSATHLLRHRPRLPENDRYIIMNGDDFDMTREGFLEGRKDWTTVPKNRSRKYPVMTRLQAEDLAELVLD
jgi:hypothetical protein